MFNRDKETTARERDLIRFNLTKVRKKKKGSRKKVNFLIFFFDDNLCFCICLFLERRHKQKFSGQSQSLSAESNQKKKEIVYAVMLRNNLYLCLLLSFFWFCFVKIRIFK